MQGWGFIPTFAIEKLNTNKTMEKIWILTQESCVNGKKLFNVIPCKDFKTAKEMMDNEIKTLLSERPYNFETEQKLNEYCTIERENEYFYMALNDDDYYEYLTIEEKQVY